ncbi:hypothetical protein ACXM0N_06865 [Peribacillus simplex]
MGLNILQTVEISQSLDDLLNKLQVMNSYLSKN